MIRRTWVRKVEPVACLLTVALGCLAQGTPELKLRTDPEVIQYPDRSTISCRGILGPVVPGFSPTGVSWQTAKYNLEIGQPAPRGQLSSDYDVTVRVSPVAAHSSPLGDITLGCKTTGPMVEHFASVKFSLSVGDNAPETVIFEKFPHQCWGDECHPLKFEAAVPAVIAPVLQWPRLSYLRAEETPLRSDHEFHQVPLGYSTDPAFVSPDDARFLPVSMSTKWQFLPEDCWDEAEGTDGDSEAKLTGIGDRDKMSELNVNPAKQSIIEVRVRPWCALWRSIGSEFSQNPSAYVWLTSTFTLAEGRRRDQRILLPVRFVATPLQVFIFGVLGVVLGTIVRCLAAGRKLITEKRLVKEIIIAVAAAIGALFVCFVGIWTNHPSAIFGLKLDPSHAGACFAIALLGSGGTIIRKWLRDAQENMNDKGAGGH